MIGRAMLIGIANPIPCALRATAVLMPITLPPESSSGPPLLPGLIAVSVWMRSWIVLPLSSWISRPIADTIPLVTVFV